MAKMSEKEGSRGSMKLALSRGSQRTKQRNLLKTESSHEWKHSAGLFHGRQTIGMSKAISIQNKQSPTHLIHPSGKMTRWSDTSIVEYTLGAGRALGEEFGPDGSLAAVKVSYHDLRGPTPHQRGKANIDTP